MFVVTLKMAGLKKVGVGVICCALVVFSAVLGRYISGRSVMAAAAAYTAVYRFCTLFAMEPWLQGMNPSLYYTVSRLVQFWM